MPLLFLSLSVFWRVAHFQFIRAIPTHKPFSFSKTVHRLLDATREKPNAKLEYCRHTLSSLHRIVTKAWSVFLSHIHQNCCFLSLFTCAFTPLSFASHLFPRVGSSSERGGGTVQVTFSTIFHNSSAFHSIAPGMLYLYWAQQLNYNLKSRQLQIRGKHIQHSMHCKKLLLSEWICARNGFNERA